MLAAGWSRPVLRTTAPADGAHPSNDLIRTPCAQLLGLHVTAPAA
jgi:hypothetical protein